MRKHTINERCCVTMDLTIQKVDVIVTSYYTIPSGQQYVMDTTEWKRKPGRQKIDWIETVKEDNKRRRIIWEKVGYLSWQSTERPGRS